MFKRFIWWFKRKKLVGELNISVVDDKQAKVVFFILRARRPFKKGDKYGFGIVREAMPYCRMSKGALASSVHDAFKEHIIGFITEIIGDLAKKGDMDDD